MATVTLCCSSYLFLDSLEYFFFLGVDSLEGADLQPAGFSLGLLRELLCVMMPFVKLLASKACPQLWIVLNFI